MFDVSEIQKRFQRAQTERREMEDIFDDAMRLTMPARPRFHNKTMRDTADDIFDETGANAVQEFVSRMQAGITPPFTNFVRLEASSLVDPRDRKAINRDLDDISAYMFEEIWSSNFAQESAEAYLDLALSTGTLLVEDGPQGLVHRAIPLTDAFHERGAGDYLTGTYRKAKVRAELVPARYPRADFSKAPALYRKIVGEKDCEVEMLEYTRKIEGRTIGAEHFVLCCDTKEPIVYRKMNGRGASPFIPFRWSTAAGETYGRGPLLNALGAIRTTNLMVELVLENASMAISGIYQTDNEATINQENVSLLPGSILAKEIGTRGLEVVNAATGNFNMRDVVLNDQRLNIKKALFNDMLSDPNKTPATATEVVERMADLAHRTSSGFSRVFYEFVTPYVWRVLRLLELRGDIEMPVQNGRAVRFRATSPLAQAQQAREMQSLVQEFQIKASIIGPDMATKTYNLEELLPFIEERMGLNDKIYKDPAEVLREIAEEAKAMQQAQMGMGGPKQGGVEALPAPIQ
jgi:hypothetical protein